jgi:hypothetical protein
MVVPESILNFRAVVVQDWLGFNSNKLSPEYNWIGNSTGRAIAG